MKRSDCNKPFQHLSFRSCAHAQVVGSPIPPSYATDRMVNSQHAIVGLWSFIGMHRCYYFYSTISWHYQEIKSSADWFSPINL